MRTRQRQLEVVRAARAKAYVDHYKMSNGCCRCGYAEHPVALHFNHINPEDKHKSVSQLVKKGVMTHIIAEIEKCEILCANCHSVHTFANKHHMEV
jgi:hypothetical protein